MEALYEGFVTYYSANIAAGSTLFPGARELLERCRKEGIALGVCTNKLEGLSVQLLDALDASHYFGAIVGPDTIGIAKPDPAPYRETLRRLGGTHLRSVMVGDSETDIKTARAAGVPVIGVTFGYTPRPVAEFGPDRLISHFDDLWPAISRTARSLTKRAAGRYRAQTLVRAISSVGRALCSHRRGHWFEVQYRPPRILRASESYSSRG